MLTPSSTDRLRVFISSTIKECAGERKIARDAVLSINLEPILFEDIGARPYPPRELYKQRLEISHIFVGIYRECYGWIAPDMDISGIDDEFNLARERGIDRLVYVLAAGCATARDPKLEAFIVKAQDAGITIAWYSKPEELRERIRNDIIAVVSSRFADQAVVSFQAPTPDELLHSLLPNEKHRFRRPNVERTILDELEHSGRMIITGPLGAGKTVLLAQLASDLNWIFVDAQGLSSLDLLVRTTNAIRSRLELTPLTLTTEDNAKRALLAAWASLDNGTIAIDSPRDPLPLLELPPAENRKLILTSRHHHVDVTAAPHFALPSLTDDEIRAWVTTLRGRRPDPNDLFKLAEESQGSPLYLRFFSLNMSAPEDLSLRDLEIRAFAALAPRAKELISYLAIYGQPLTLGDVGSLLGVEGGAQSVVDCISGAETFLRLTKRNIELVHEHPRRTILASLRGTPTRLNYFGVRLGRYFEELARYVAAFQAYSEAGERRSADRVLENACHQAMLLGGGAPAIPILKRQVELARELGQTETEISALLGLSHALRQTGLRDEASRALCDAKEAATQSGNEFQLLKVQETAIVLDLSPRPRAERIDELAALRSSYSTAGDEFNAARIETLLTTEYIASADYLNAERAARAALSFFDSVGDEYGSRIARVNLAASLGGQDGREHEAAEIAFGLEQTFEPSEFPRERAVLCNFLTRHYRKLGDTALASDFAKEAIAIGEQLQDHHIIAVNRVNLGNVLRDADKLDLALIEYRKAEQCGLASGIRVDEAAANELIASVLSAQRQFAIAIHHADYALAIARDIGDAMLTARAGEERGIALKGQGELDASLIAYAGAAKAIASYPPSSSYFATLVDEALGMCTSSGRVDLKTELLRSIFIPDSLEPGASQDPLAVLYLALPAMVTCIDVERLLPIVALTLSDLLGSVPPVIERRIILKLAEILLSEESAFDARSALAAFAAVMMTQSGKCLALGDICDMAQRVVTSFPGVYFKAHNDGASHWTVRLSVGNGVIVTVAQLDDDVRTAVATMTIALLLASQQSVIGKHLLQAERFPRNEAIIQLISKKEFEERVSSDMLKSADMSMGFVVAETTDVARLEQPPIIAICADDFGAPWRPNEHAFSDTHFLLGRILKGLVAHLLAKVVESEVLSPKIGRAIRAIGYRGSADQPHARLVTGD